MKLAGSALVAVVAGVSACSTIFGDYTVVPGTGGGTTGSATAGSGGSSSSGSTASSGTGGMPAANGAPCTAADQCVSGVCADGFCCATVCSSACQACSEALTGGTNGTCSDVKNGTMDPRGICTVTAQSTCGTDGTCNAGACQEWAAGTVCAAASCSTTTGTQTTATTCNGSGTCAAGTMTACAPYVCGGTACKTSCAVDADCVAGDLCSLSGCVTKLSAVSAGGMATCAVTAAGGARCWGDNTYGELGNNSTTQSNVPVGVSGLSSGVSAISAGGAFACALTTEGGVLCWGDNTFGELGNNSATQSNVPVAVSGLSSGVSAISAGGAFACALTTGGGGQCWGDNAAGELGNNSTTQSNMPVAVSGLLSGVAAIAAGGDHTCALTTAGGVQCWGNNGYGQLGNNSLVLQSSVPVAVSGLSSGVAAITAGGSHTCALTTAGGVECWGYNQWGQLGTNSSTLSSSVPVTVVGLASGVAAISAGGEHTCALTTAGGVQCWGDNMNGQLGNNSFTTALVPVAVPGLPSGVAAITAGGSHTCALTTAGAAQCWGDNMNGQLGNNSTTQSKVPVSVDDP